MRSKGKIKPAITVTDDIGYVYETDDSGEYKRTTGLIQKLEDAEIVSKSAVMSMPSQEALNAALHMVAYVYDQRERGIRFSSDGNRD